MLLKSSVVIDPEESIRKMTSNCGYAKRVGFTDLDHRSFFISSITLLSRPRKYLIIFSAVSFAVGISGYPKTEENWEICYCLTTKYAKIHIESELQNIQRETLKKPLEKR